MEKAGSWRVQEGGAMRVERLSVGDKAIRARGRSRKAVWESLRSTSVESKGESAVAIESPAARQGGHRPAYPFERKVFWVASDVDVGATPSYAITWKKTREEIAAGSKGKAVAAAVLVGGGTLVERLACRRALEEEGVVQPDEKQGVVGVYMEGGEGDAEVYRCGSFLQKLAETGGPAVRCVLLVSKRRQRVGSAECLHADAGRRYAGCALWGLGRAARTEYPNRCKRSS